ncbi:MAG: outer membrane protein [Patiriisocius sp.]|jgi:outer membrane protein
MKKLLPIVVFLLIGLSTSAQKFAFVDTKYILENMPEYESAQNEIDDVSSGWQDEIAGRYDVIERLYKSYQAEQVIMTDEMKADREEDIMNKEREAKALQKQRFGVEGDLFKKRQELILPIQEKIWDAIREYALEGAYMAILDKSSDSGVLYANSKYDKSDKVLRKMGIRPGDNKKAKEESSGSSKESTSPKSDAKGGVKSAPSKK